jgi:two-component system phosphate regulon sensor histidine kinase PhoR
MIVWTRHLYIFLVVLLALLAGHYKDLLWWFLLLVIVAIGLYKLAEEQLRRSENKTSLGDMRDSLAALDEGVVITDSEGKVEWSNQAANYYLGVRLEDYYECDLFQLIDAQKFTDYFEACRYQTPLGLKSPRKKNIRLQLHFSLLDSGSRLIFIRDITRTHKLENLRRDFVANVSHELKTPLTVIHGFLSTYADIDEGDDERWSRALKQMLSQSRRMDSLISELLLLSRLETVPEALNHERIDMRSFLTEMGDDALLACNYQRKLTIHCDDRIVLRGCRKELHSAFNNLLMNAIKYSEKGDSIVVSWHQDNEFAYLDVEDDGKGIETKHLSRLTERFYRVDKSRSANTGGTGLGLAIVKHVLLRHQAEVKITSTFGVGSKFSCVFPLSRISPAKLTDVAEANSV